MLYCVLLAGGLSSRMGLDKSKLKLNDETLLERSLNLLKSLKNNQILISGEVESYDCVPDLLSQCGPLGGLYSSLAFIKQRYALDSAPLLIIPVDMPALNQDAINRVLEGLGDAQCCHYENEVFPCVMRASEELFVYLEEAFSESTRLGGKRSMKGLMAYLKPNVISTEGLNPEVFFNANNPEEWKYFVRAMK